MDAPRNARVKNKSKAGLLPALALAVVVAGAGDAAFAAKVKPKSFVKANITAQSGDNADAELVEITGPAGFVFAKAATFATIDKIAITATLGDADTGPGDFDEGELFLALDGIDTGIALNGFRNNEVDTRTLNGAPLNAAQILQALKVDNKLVASIIDKSAADNGLEAPTNFQTTLEIRGTQKAKKK